MAMPSLFDPDPGLEDGDPDPGLEDDGDGDDGEFPLPLEERPYEVDSDDEEGDEDDSEEEPEPSDGGSDAAGDLPPIAELTPEQRVGELFDLPRERPEPVRLSELVLEYHHWQNPRQFTGLDDEAMQALAQDILSKSVTTEDGLIAGILSPLLVVKIRGPNASVVQLVLDGQRRYKAIEMAAAAAKAKGDGERAIDVWVKVVDREPEPVEWTEPLALKYLAEVLGAVGQRQGLSGYELSESAMRLRGTTNPDTGAIYTIAQIALRIGRSPSWVSKILSARDKASPKLLSRWRRGELTEEIFKDLAVGVADKEQDQAADAITAERQAGDKSTARRAAKEQAQLVKAKEKADREQRKADNDTKKAAKGKKEPKEPKKDKAVRGPQAELPMATSNQDRAGEPDKSSNVTPKSKPKPVAYAVVEDLVSKSKEHPPTHDLVKGIILGLCVATGMTDMETLPKPWHTYILHLSGAKPDKKASKKARKK